METTKSKTEIKEVFNSTCVDSLMILISYALNLKQRLHSRPMHYNVVMLQAMMMIMVIQLKEKNLITKMTTPRVDLQSFTQVVINAMKTQNQAIAWKSDLSAMRKRISMLNSSERMDATISSV